jgi:hypothetical protein
VRGERLALLSSDQNCFSREIWRRTSTFRFLRLLAGWAPLRASTPVSECRCIACREVQPTLPYRRRIADSPPPLNEYDFEISLHMDCLIHVGFYESAIDYLPSMIAADQSVDVSVEKHVMRVRAPGKEITFEITRHYGALPGSCNSGY